MGTGKSSLGELLSDKYQIPFLEEQAEIEFEFSNLCLENLKTIDTGRRLKSLQHYCIQSQIINLRKGLNLSLEYGACIVASHPLAVWYQYVAPLYKQQVFTKEEAFEMLGEITSSLLPTPQLQINLLASPLTILKRIEQRDRKGEKVDKEFIRLSVENFSIFAINETRNNSNFLATESIGIDCSNRKPFQVAKELENMDLFTSLKYKV